MVILRTFLILLLTASLHAATYYVDNAATGSANGTSWVNAWTNLAAISASSGDTVYISGGTTNKTYSGVIGFTTAPNVTITYGRDSGHNGTVIVTGDGSYAVWGNQHGSVINGYEAGTTNRHFKLNNCVFFGDTHDCIVNGVEVDRTALNYTSEGTQTSTIIMRQVSGTSYHNQVLNSYAHDTSGNGIQMLPAGNDAASACVVSNCFVTRVGEDAVDISGNCQVLNCTLIQTPSVFLWPGGHPDGIQLYYVNGNAKGNVTCANNWVEWAGQNIFIEYASSNIFLYNNVLIGNNTNHANADRGLNLSYVYTAHDGYDFTGTFLVANNVVIGFPSGSGINGGCPAGSVIENNIFVSCKVNVGSELAAQMTTNNIWWDVPGQLFYDYDENGAFEVVPENRYSGSMIHEDPLLVSLTAHDFRPLIGSPVIGAGVNLSSYFTNDFEGIARGAAWDIGAFENLAEAPSISTQPTSIYRQVGTSATFTISATGTAPLAYQWSKGASAITDATNATYAISSCALSDAGPYSCTVTNAYGTATSSTAVLSVVDVKPRAHIRSQ